MNEPRVDVLMPVGPGQQAWLGQAVTSILAQEGVSVRLVVVLDNRPDVPEAGPYMRDPRVKVLTNKGTPGVAGALRYGITQCESEWVARQDSDDVSHPLRLVRQLQAAQGRVCLVGSASHTIRGGQEFSWDHSLAEVVSVQDVAPLTALSWNPFVHSSILLNREVALSVGSYRTQADGLEDYDLWLRMMAIGSAVNVVDRLIAYRLHDNQRTRSRRSWRAYASVAVSAHHAARTLNVPRRDYMLAQYAYFAGQLRLKAGRRGHHWLSRRGDEPVETRTACTWSEEQGVDS